ncbi:MAG: hypothetical protein Q9208_006163 [Pyrenodesmia sp. 3 TL-2023]
MADLPKTPTSSAKGQANKRPRTQIAGDDDERAATSSQAATTSVTPKGKITKNARNERDALEDHFMFFDNEEAQIRNKDFFKNVHDILAGDRSSATSEATVDIIKKTQNTNRTAMENTYAAAVIPLYKGVSRTPAYPPTTSEALQSPIPTTTEAMVLYPPTLREAARPVAVEFEKDRLHWEGPCYFVKDSLSGNKSFGLSDPQPDMGFGIRKKSLELNPVKLSGEAKNLIRAAGCLDHCFSITELKGPDLPFSQAVTQAMRAGVKLVRAKREAWLRAGYGHVKSGADPNSWVFTMAWEHGRVDVFVCWHESLPGGEIDHQTWLDTYALLRKDDIRRFRRDLHNILDWGLNPQRVAGLEQMVRDIAAKEAADAKVKDVAAKEAVDGTV